MSGQWRAAAWAAAGLLTAGGLWLWQGGGGPVLLIVGLVAVGGVLVDRGYKTPLETGSPGPGWVGTDERFVDPETGRMTRVWIKPASGERRYVAE